MNNSHLFSTQNNRLRNKLWEIAFERLEKSLEEQDRRLERQLKIEKAGMKSFCQEKRNFNELKVSATQANAQSVLGGFWIN